MLAQNFKTPKYLGITDREFETLVKVMGMLERQEIPAHKFKMNRIGNPECGTAGCICGWARSLDKGVFVDDWKGSVGGLFIRPYHMQLRNATPGEAAIAIRNYLTTGEARWHEAMVY